MAKILIPEALLSKLGPSMAMDVHWVDIRLNNGQVLKKLVVRDGRFITGFHRDPDGESDLEFDTDDIADLRRTSILPFW